MLDQRNFRTVALKKMPNNQFFVVVSSTADERGSAQYKGKCMICVHQNHLPLCMRQEDENDGTALFVYRRSEQPEAGRVTRVIVDEVHFDMPDSTIVRPVVPLGEKEMPSGARLFVDNAEIKSGSFIDLGRVDTKGRLFFQPQSRGGKPRRRRPRRFGGTR